MRKIKTKLKIRKGEKFMKLYTYYAEDGDFYNIIDDMIEAKKIFR